MSFQVVDTNVAIVANAKAPQAGPECVLECVAALERIVHSGGIVIDDDMQIIREYLARLSLSGQPGAGDAFMKWVWLNQGDTERCEQVSITPSEADSRCFLEFPDDPRLQGFDRSDRKYVAVALKSTNNPNILNAVDSDWWQYRHTLAEHKVRIEFLCPNQFQGLDSRSQ